jgi:putative restriction endonuclease
MREVSPGDIIFSFVDTRIAAIGVAQSFCWESPKPQEFGTVGQNWENIGWKVAVKFTLLIHAIRPKDHIDLLQPVLPSKYSPLQSNGNGIQSIYLTEIPTNFAEVLGGLIGPEFHAVISGLSPVLPSKPMQFADDLDYWDRELEKRVEADRNLSDTEREALIRARRGQGLFKQRVQEIEKKCRVTHVEKLVHLVGSHCKPWRDSNNDERLNGENGLLLTPTIDHLFGRGFIGFEDSGTLVISPVAHRPSLQRMGIETERIVNVGGFTEGQRRFLDFHRNSVLLKAAR